MNEEFGRSVIELVGVHRLDDTQVVGDAVQVRNRVGHPDAALAALLELAARAHQFRGARGEGKHLPFHELVGALLAIPPHQFGLVVEQVEMRWRTGQVQVDDAFGLRGEVGRASGQGILRGIDRRPFAAEQLPERGGAEPDAAVLEKMPPSVMLEIFEFAIHSAFLL